MSGHPGPEIPRSEGGPEAVSATTVAACTVPDAWWVQQCDRVATWLSQQHAEVRDALWLLPQVAHVGLAQAAWARGPGGWMPRIQALADLQRAPGAASDGLSLDAALDRWRALKLLRSLAWGRELARRDARAFEALAARLLTLARGFAQAWASQSDTTRADWLVQARQRLVHPGPVAEQERALARLALEWAAMGEGSWVDAALAPVPTAVMVLEPAHEARPTSFTQQLLQSANSLGLPACRFAVSAADVVAVGPHRMQVCEGFEDEAMHTAAQVLRALADADASADPKPAPVALVAQDRRLIRRVRALLEGAGVSVSDETGWTLSTTRAAASVMGLLRLTDPRATSDELLDWLKSSGACADAPQALDALESALRRCAWTRADPAGLPPRDAERMSGAAMDLWQRVRVLVEALRWPGALDLAEALGRLNLALDACGLGEWLEQDDAGRQLCQALHLRTSAPSWAHEAGGVSLREFVEWVDAVLEASSFQPPEGPKARVRVLPLARALWRPFSAVVFPAVDAQHLGAAAAPWPWLGEGDVAALGLPTQTERLGRERWAFESLLALPAVTLLRRRSEGDAMLSASPLVERLGLAWARQGRTWEPARPALQVHERGATPVPRPLPRVHQARSLWPSALNATSCESLRACPYQFYARNLLGLREADELDDEIERRDVGTWLHEVLQRFHEQRRQSPRHAVDDLARLKAVAAEVQHALAYPDDAFLPHAAWFEVLAPRYLEWLAVHEAQGHEFAEGELDLAVQPDALRELGLKLQGRIDRVDLHHGLQGRSGLLIIDYKTSRAEALKRKMNDPQEDTQLPFYAALLAHGPQAASLQPSAITAAYLPLETDPVALLVHEEVQVHAQDLLDGLAQDWARMAEGSPLPALGEGRTCDYCEMRGMCRKDHWASLQGDAP